MLDKDISPVVFKFCAQIFRIQFSLSKDIKVNNRSEWVKGKVCQGNF